MIEDPKLFTSCVFSAIENEGDPRNLLLVFDLVHFILLNFYQENVEDNENFVEDAFDKVSIYFPINF
jgi:hypothetical protein